MKFLREPLVHFMFIGSLIYGLFGLFAEQEVEITDNTIVISATEIEVFKSSWQKRWNRLPTEKELDGLIQEYIRETVLYRQAISMGLDKNDRVIRRRLAQNMQFLVEDLATMLDPDEQTLQAWYKDNSKLFLEPPKYTFTQIFLDPDKRGDTTLDDATQIMLKLQAQTDPLKDISELGDGLMMQDYYPEKTPIEIQKQFGSGFTQSLLGLSPGEWHGPVLSGYGVHLVYIQNISEASTPPLASIIDQVKAEWMLEQRAQLNKNFYDKLISTYDIVIEESKTDVLQQGNAKKNVKNNTDKTESHNLKIETKIDKSVALQGVIQ